MPYDVAFTLRPHEVAAYAITFSEFAGNTFNWDAMRFEERE